MEIDRNTLLIIGALGIGAYYFMSGSSSSGYKFYVPGQGYVDEHLLPSMGYQKVNGMWYSPAQITDATNQAGYPSVTPVNQTVQTFNDIMAILNTLIPLTINTVNLIVNATNRPQVEQAIIQKYTLLSSPDYIPMFAYPTSAYMVNLTNAQLQTLLNTGMINGINGYNAKTCSDAGASLRTTGSSQAGSTMAHCKWGTTRKKPIKMKIK